MNYNKCTTATAIPKTTFAQKLDLIHSEYVPSTIKAKQFLKSSHMGKKNNIKPNW